MTCSLHYTCRKCKFQEFSVDNSVPCFLTHYNDSCVPQFCCAVYSVAFEGRLLTLGWASGEIPKMPANLLLVKNFSVHGVFFGPYASERPDLFQNSITSVLKLWQDGKIRPLVGKIFSLKEVCKSHFIKFQRFLLVFWRMMAIYLFCMVIYALSDGFFCAI
jgi:hypothetical protein